VSARQLARETGVNQQNLSRWLQEARSLPIMADKPKPLRGRVASDLLATPEEHEIDLDDC